MIRRSEAGGVVTLTIDRPDKANSLTLEMLEDLDAGVRNAQGAAALVLTGVGKVFSAGADLEAARAGLATHGVWERLSGAVAAFPGLTLAALNGTVAGGAMGMVLACDLRAAVPEAAFFYPVMKLGFLPQPSDPARLKALVGPSRAKRILLAGEKISAETAETWGLIDAMVSADAMPGVVAGWTAAAVGAKADVRVHIKRMLG